jgi:hypothetical protein
MDCTYRINKYKLPLLGYGLLQSRDEPRDFVQVCASCFAPPENSKLGILLVAVNVTVSFLCLLRDLVIPPIAGGSCEACCRANDAAHSKPIGCPIGFPLARMAMYL